MAVKLRLTRVGKTKQPQYRIVAADSRSPRDGRFIQIVGTYNPRTEPSALKVDNAKAVKWLLDGAQPTERVQKLLQEIYVYLHEAKAIDVDKPAPGALDATMKEWENVFVYYSAIRSTGSGRVLALPGLRAPRTWDPQPMITPGLRAPGTERMMLKQSPDRKSVV